MAESSLDSLRLTREVQVEWRAYELRPAGTPEMPPETEAAYRKRVAEGWPRVHEIALNRFSVNVICWFGRDMAAIGDQVLAFDVAEVVSSPDSKVTHVQLVPTHMIRLLKLTEEERSRALDWLASKATRQTIKDQIDWLKRQVETRRPRGQSWWRRRWRAETKDQKDLKDVKDSKDQRTASSVSFRSFTSFWSLSAARGYSTLEEVTDRASSC